MNEVSSSSGRGKERAGEVQQMGYEEQREVHLPRLRFLLGTDPSQSELLRGQAQDQQEEIPNLVAQDERLAEEVPKLATQDAA